MSQHPAHKRPRLRVSAILEDNERILLVPHYSHEMGDRVWFLPGGDMLHGDTLRAATERYVARETGYQVRAAELRGIFEDIQVYRAFHSLCFIYTARILGGELKAGPESTRPQWFDVRECPELRLYPPFSQWDNLVTERFSAQRWDGPDRVIAVLLDKKGQILLCQGDESRTWWPIRLELEPDEQPRHALDRLLAHGSQAAWPLAGEPQTFPMRVAVVVARFDNDTPLLNPEIATCTTYTWTDPALLTTYNMDPAVLRLVYDVLKRLPASP